MLFVYLSKKHGLYLLFQIAMVDKDWYDIVFDSTKNTFRKHIANINDKSCLSVLYTVMLEICYFSGYQRCLDWSAITVLGMKEIPQLPIQSSIVPFTPWKAAAELLLRQKVLRIRALKSNVQLVVQLLEVSRRNKASCETELYKDMIEWMSERSSPSLQD